MIEIQIKILEIFRGEKVMVSQSVGSASGKTLVSGYPLIHPRSNCQVCKSSSRGPRPRIIPDSRIIFIVIIIPESRGILKNCHNKNLVVNPTANPTARSANPQPRRILIITITSCNRVCISDGGIQISVYDGTNRTY